ncbi:MAG: BlaI/MecI/CopY family transcriptional regulator [Planctomycetales bacterium]|nr:BlaI/MecI/CopY family transcriptional regulator [Planctomycetales bacterium]MCA9166840.1 BlaI/MecI/CopY family transcriptional regulator [Planctomycetales bacterium]
MARPASPQPTDLELQLLNILWERAPLAASEIRDLLAETGRDIAHTSVLTTLNTMVKKKYLVRKKVGKAFLFSARVERGAVSQRLLKNVLNSVFGGSAKAVLSSLFDCTEINADEIKELRRLINSKAKETE